VIETVSGGRGRRALGPFARRVLTVAGGTAIGQAMLVAASPLLTRLYDPDELGTLAAYMAIVAVLGVVASLRYQLAIVLADDEDRAVAVAALCMVLVLVTTLVAGVVLVLSRGAIATWLSAPALADTMWLVALGTGVLGVQQVIAAWGSRAGAWRSLGVA
jgi:O-antigen/teichoic acid export membrane protein